MGVCENYDAKSAKLCMISTPSMQFHRIIMEYNGLTDLLIVGILNTILKNSWLPEDIPASATWYSCFC
jgi:hypothetical protein